MNALQRIIDLFKFGRNPKPSPGDVVIEVPTAHIDIGPFGFYRYADEYHQAANAIIPRNSFSPVPYYLYCRSLELGLKAYLLTKGLSQKDLKLIFGHNLTKLLNKAKRKGLLRIFSIERTEEEVIRNANVYYKSKALEYFDLYRAGTGYRDLPELTELAKITSNLLASIERECKDYSRKS